LIITFCLEPYGARPLYGLEYLAVVEISSCKPDKYIV
jgi:hypothetical protein